MPQETFIPTETSTHLEFRNVFNSNAVEAEQRLTFLEERLDLDVHDPLKSYSVGEMFYYSAKAYRVNTDLNVGETPTTNPEKVDQIGVAIGSEVNDLTSSVTWANVPDANITQSSVIQHTGAFQISESQIVDLTHPAEVNDLTSAVTWANVPDANITQSSVIQHTGAFQISESQIVDLTHPSQVDDTAYGVGWDGDTTTAPSKNAVYDKIETLGGGHTIQDEGTPLTARTNLNFVGAGVEATDDAGNDATIVTINGGGGGSSVVKYYVNNSYVVDKLGSAADVIQSVTEMSYAMEAGKTYYVKYFINHTGYNSNGTDTYCYYVLDHTPWSTTANIEKGFVGTRIEDASLGGGVSYVQSDPTQYGTSTWNEGLATKTINYYFTAYQGYACVEGIITAPSSQTFTPTISLLGDGTVNGTVSFQGYILELG
jgi:hypothetical protein